MAAPGTPVNFIAQQGNGQVLLTWDISTGSTSYKIYRSTDGVTYSLLTSVAPNLYLDTAVTVGSLYYYQVAASNIGGDSPLTSAQNIIPVMQGQMSLSGLRLQAKQRADRVNSQFVGDAEWNVYINQASFELYDLLITQYEDYYIAPQASFVTTGQQFAPLPDGITSFLDSTNTPFVAKPFYKLVGVDCGLSSNNNARVSLRKFDFIERNRYIYPNITSSFLGVFNLKYRLMGNQLEFIPAPGAGQYITIWYIPKMTQLLKDTDILDGISGWTEYVIVDAAIRALQKEESDVSVLMAQKQMLIDRIQASSMNRDAGMPDTISDTRSLSGSGGRYGGPGFDGPYGGY